MILKSFSKINLSLSVHKKIKNGLHDIQSYFCLLNLFDEIKIKKNDKKKDIIEFKGKFAKYVNNKKNSISETLVILRRWNVINNYYSVIIHKKIPVFAGLGGGTSNAAYLIKYFIKKKINKDLLENLKKIVGSDFKLFLQNQGFLKNLETVIHFKKNYKLYFLLIYPNIKSSTKHVYSKVKKYSSTSKFDSNKIDSKNKFINFLKKKSNDLQSIVENKHPIIRKLVNEIKHKQGCSFSRMSGSGSV